MNPYFIGPKTPKPHIVCRSKTESPDEKAVKKKKKNKQRRMEIEDVKFPKIVRLSVGGVQFTTSLDTLLS